MDKLIVVAANINAAHRRVAEHGEEMLQSARQVGEMLLRAKENVPHGDWAHWQQEHLEFTPRTAQRYMKIADNWDELEPATSMEGALKQLTGPKTTEPSDLDDEEVIEEDADWRAQRDLHKGWYNTLSRIRKEIESAEDDFTYFTDCDVLTGYLRRAAAMIRKNAPINDKWETKAGEK